MSAFTLASDALDGLPAGWRVSLGWKPMPWLTSALLLVVLASIALALATTARADADLNRRYQTALAEYRTQANQIQVLNGLAMEESKIAETAATDASLLDASPRSRVLADAANAAGAGVRLTALSIGEEGDHSTGVDVGVTVQGIAQSEQQATSFVAALARCTDLCDVQRVADRRPVHGIGPRRFSVEARLAAQ